MHPSDIYNSHVHMPIENADMVYRVNITRIMFTSIGVMARPIVIATARCGFCVSCYYLW